MSKQMDAKGMLTNEQYELARTLYMQWLRKANTIVQLPTRESSPRKKQKMGGPSLFRGASLVEGLEGSRAARTQNDGFDPVTDEIERWERLSPDSFSEFVNDGSLLNEFAMMWELRERERFPQHFIVFKQTACHLSHEANVEQVFFRAGNLSDPNMDPEYTCLRRHAWTMSHASGGMLAQAPPAWTNDDRLQSATRNVDSATPNYLQQIEKQLHHVDPRRFRTFMHELITYCPPEYFFSMPYALYRYLVCGSPADLVSYARGV
jgi:hypothetical protein